MNKKMREILAKIQAKTAEAKNYMEGENKDVEKANGLMDEVDALQKEFDTEKRLYEAEKLNGSQSVTVAIEDSAQKATKPEKLTGEQLIAKEVRAIMAPGKYASDKSLQESVDANGGYTVPEDISTKVEHYKDVDYALESDIDVVSVTTNKGARTFQKKGDVDLFVDINEDGTLDNEIKAPTFERLPYVIQDRAGFMPVSNDLLDDSDANIMGIMVDWLGKSRVATTNAKILAKIKEKTQTDLKDIDGIKKAVNVTLGQAYKTGAKIYTNDDGLNYLDTLKDANGRPLLNPDPTDSAKLTLRCGTTVLPIKVLPNKVLKTDTNKVPFIVGNLFDYVRKYDRRQMTITASNIASIGDFNAFAQNMTLLRAILRDDYRVKDADSIVNGYITVAGE